MWELGFKVGGLRVLGFRDGVHGSKYEQGDVQKLLGVLSSRKPTIKTSGFWRFGFNAQHKHTIIKDTMSVVQKRTRCTGQWTWNKDIVARFSASPFMWTEDEGEVVTSCDGTTNRRLNLSGQNLNLEGHGEVQVGLESSRLDV